MFAAALVMISILADTPPVAIIPAPRKVETAPGQLSITREIRICALTGEQGVATSFGHELEEATGLKVTVVPSGSAPAEFQFHLDSSLASLGAEGYRLVISPDSATISAPHTAGLFYGTRTIRQLMPVETFGKHGHVPFQLPCLTIEDSPRFGWRGAHLDVGRYFMPIPYLKTFINQLALHKMNILHLHLTEDQGWRIEIKRYPKLTSVGSRRKDSQTNDAPDEFSGKPHEGWYSQAELRDLVNYAKERFVEIMPEIEMPGHVQAALAAYPELGNTGKPIDVATGWGVHVDVLNVEDTTVRFFENVLDEVIDIFPFPYVHVGGDEVPTGQWKSSAAAQLKMKALGFRNESQLQGWFMKQVSDHLKARGRKMVGWDEVLETGAPEGSTIMCWRGEEPGVRAAKLGHDVVMSPANWTYFDQAQTRDKKVELPRSWGNLGLERLYRFEPIPKELNAYEAKHILGAQSALWTETVPEPTLAQFMLFPRLSVISEVMWSSSTGRSYPEFRKRLLVDVERLDRLGIRHHPVEELRAPRIGGWQSGQVSTSAHVHEWDATAEITGPGLYQVQFDYTGGDHALEVSECQLLQNGVVVAFDSHVSTAGAVTNEVDYMLELMHFQKGAKYVVRARVRSDGGTDSNGDVRIKRLKSSE